MAIIGQENLKFLALIDSIQFEQIFTAYIRNINLKCWMFNLWKICKLSESSEKNIYYEKDIVTLGKDKLLI